MNAEAGLGAPVVTCPRWSVADLGMVHERHCRPDADATFAGTARQLYLGLWNRGTVIIATGTPGGLERWRRCNACAGPDPPGATIRVPRVEAAFLVHRPLIRASR